MKGFAWNMVQASKQLKLWGRSAIKPVAHTVVKLFARLQSTFPA